MRGEVTCRRCRAGTETEADTAEGALPVRLNAIGDKSQIVYNNNLEGYIARETAIEGESCKQSDPAYLDV